MSTHKQIYTHILRHTGTDKQVQQSGDFEKQFYSLTYLLINPFPTCMSAFLKAS